MTSVDPIQLRQQVDRLAALYEQPKAFCSQLDDLLDFYATRRQRQGKIRRTRPVLFSYKVPPQVLRQIILELKPLVQADTQSAFDLSEALWKVKKLEQRQLAARLLGSVSVRDDFLAASERIRNWAGENREESLIEELGRSATASMRAQKPEALLDFSAELMGSGNRRVQAVGAQSLEALIAENHYANLPSVFDTLRPIAQEASKGLRTGLTKIFISLAEQSPKETAYFLQQRLAEKPDSELHWIARQSLKSFPEDERAGLRATLNG